MKTTIAKTACAALAESDRGNAGTPKWSRVQALVIKLIESGHIHPQEALPSDREIAKMARCSLQPVVRAMQDLERRGLVQRRPGAPTIVLTTRPTLDDSAFSFSKSPHDQSVGKLTTRIVELARRPVRKGPAWAHEVQALRALGLSPRSELIAVVRIRMFDGVPRVVHRSYLNPKHYDEAFLARYDFADESLIRIFNSEGYAIQSRDTVLAARIATPEEQTLLNIGPEAVLDVRQELHATHERAGGPLTIEYLAATYLRWEYRVYNRAATAAATQSAKARPSTASV